MTEQAKMDSASKDIHKPLEAEKEVVDPSTPSSPISTPILVVEKVDSMPSHGDDMGPNATAGQKEAHKLRAEDAEPDYVVVRPESHTPEIADVAAEVADSAASLDKDPPSPTVSDREAGRIGLRRMSNTPIPEVANTAAEVADSAAKLDEEYDQKKPVSGSTLDKLRS